MTKFMPFFKVVMLLILFSIACLPKIALAQSGKPGMDNLSNVKASELSQTQLKQFKARYLAEGKDLEGLEAELVKRNMDPIEAQNLVKRIMELDVQQSQSQREINGDEDLLSEPKAQTESKYQVEEAVFMLLKPKIFGSELFNNPKLTFEPNLKMATPANYQLGPDDELIIDIFGFSEQSYKIKVSAEGHVRIPNLGPVQVAGLTVNQAESKISRELIKIYPRIASGETKVAVNVGSIRSIKVSVIGEVNLPGTFTLPSVATVINALHAAGGPNGNGSFRKIQLVRGNKVIARLDVYELLMTGFSKGNLPLKDQDVIRVEAYDSRVEVKGFVKREGYYEVLPKDKFLNLLGYAGGFSSNAYEDRIKVTRNTGLQKKMLDLTKSQFAMFVPQNGDEFIVDSILSRFENRISISGAVFRPGDFSLDENKTLGSLIEHAGGVKEDAFLTRVTILRTNNDNTLSTLSFDLSSLESAKAVELKREDKITIASKLEMREEPFVNITGEVKNPGKYPYAANMQVEDLIILAGGIKESASLEKVQIAQRISNADRANASTLLSSVKEVNINVSLNGNSGAVLNPFDIVTIFPKPGYVQQKKVEIRGEVMYPGSYAILKGNERVSDVIARAGGITGMGYAGGAILIRKRQNNYQDQIIKENKLLALKKQTKDTAKVAKLIEEEMRKSTDVVGIDLAKILKKPGSKEDVVLAEDDILEIPAINQTVLVSGEVLYPVRISYGPGKGFKSYISNAGGYSAKAMRRRAYIVYPNGTAKDTKSFLGIKIYPKVLPGSELVVPPKEERKNLTALEIVTIATSLTSMLVLITTLIQ